MRSIPKPYEIYRHFKGNLYQIIAVAKDSESDRKVVVYQALYGDYAFYVRDLENFCSATDKNKYPDADQEYRFEKVQDDGAENANSIINEKSYADADNTGIEGVDPAVIEFLDADSYEQKLNILASIKNRATEEMLAAMAIGADIELPEGSIEDK